MNAIGGSRVSKVESTFKESRKAMVAGDTADAKAHVDELKTMLVEDAAALDGGAGSEVGGFTRLITSSFGQAFLILIREGLEALLVVAAIIAYLVKSGNRRLVRWIYLGVVAGLAASGVIAAVFMALFGGSGPQQEIMEGVCALVAMGMLLGGDPVGFLLGSAGGMACLGLGGVCYLIGLVWLRALFEDEGDS